CSQLRVDAAAWRHRLNVCPCQAAESGGNFQPGPDRTFGRVFLRRRKAEKCHDAVAPVLRDMDVVSADDRGANLAVLLQQTVHVFGVKLARKRSPTDQIAEDHGDLTALNTGRLGAWGIHLRGMISRLGAARAEFCHSGKKFSAMT